MCRFMFGLVMHNMAKDDIWGSYIKEHPDWEYEKH